MKENSNKHNFEKIVEEMNRRGITPRLQTELKVKRRFWKYGWVLLALIVAAAIIVYFM